MTAAETLIAAAERLERDTADLRRTWQGKGLPASERMARRVAIDTALAALLRWQAEFLDWRAAKGMVEADETEHGSQGGHLLAVARAILGGAA